MDNIDDLFDLSEINSFQPLADRMRPKSLDKFFGQSHIVGDSKPLREAILGDHLHSMIFWGPPGTGKTTLAKLIANHSGAYFHSLSAVLSGVKDIREAVTVARRMKSEQGKRTILFIDEVHRFNKSQQDALLPDQWHLVHYGSHIQRFSYRRHAISSSAGTPGGHGVRR